MARAGRAASPVHGLTTRGRSLVAAGVAAAACALVLDERDLLRVGVLLVALPLLVSVALGAARLTLAIGRVVDPAVLSVGGTSRVTLTLSTSTRLPVAGLLLSDTVPPVLGDTPCYAVGTLQPGAATPVTYEVQPRQRGRHTLGPVELRLTDPLGLVELRRSVAGTTSVLVRPALSVLSGVPGHVRDPVETGGASSGLGGSQQSLQDALVRPYRDGDDLRSVHWRSTARRGELMVRPQEQTRRSGTVVLLDVRAAAHHGVGQHSTLERAVAFAGSAAAHLQTRHQPVRLITSAGADLGSGDVALDRLALLTPVPGASLAGAAEVAAQDDLIAVLGAVDQAGAETLTATTALLGAGRAVVFGGEGAGVAHLRRAGWSVVLAGQRATAAQVWQQLCTTSAVAGVRS